MNHDGFTVQTLNQTAPVSIRSEQPQAFGSLSLMTGAKRQAGGKIKETPHAPTTMNDSTWLAPYKALRDLVVILTALCTLLWPAVGAHAQGSGCVTDRAGKTICPAPDARCLQDRYDAWFCSAPGGDIARNRHGELVCGVGLCVIDSRGDVLCSKAARGPSAIDRTGVAVCSQGCEMAQAKRCTALTR